MKERRLDKLGKLGLVSLFMLAPAGAMAQQGPAHSACGGELNEVCTGLQPGEGRLMACVKEHLGQLSAHCQNALLSNVTITKACKADAEQKCAGVQPGGGRIQACMRDHFSELSDPCKHALLLARLHRQ
jgi:Cysteine rich repeat